MIRRLVLSYLALTLAVLAALEIPLAVNYASRLEGQLTADLQRDAFAIASFSEDTVEGRGNADLQQLAENYAAQSEGARVVIVDASGTAVADSNPSRPDESFANRPEISDALAGQPTSGRRPSETLGTDLVYVAVPIASGTVTGAVRVSYSTNQLNDRVRAYWLTLAAIGAISLTAAAGIGIALARGVAQPLAELEETATALGQGDLAARAPADSGPPEVRELARSFNATAGRLEELVSAQEQFVADASHQLRTPLTALRLRLENLQDEFGDRHDAADLAPADRAAVEADLAAALDETIRLSRLVDGLLALARADRTDTTATAEDLAVAQVLDDRAEMWGPVAEERQVAIAYEPTGARVRATPDRLSQILDNLIANALEVAPAGSTLTLRAGTVDGPGGDVEIHVVDEGPGLTDEQRAHAFDRFWRASSTRSELGGSGLGLAIVRKLARADGGDAELRAAPDGGVDAVVVLPAVR